MSGFLLLIAWTLFLNWSRVADDSNRHCQRLCKNVAVRRHVCIVFSPKQPIAMFWFNYPSVS